jgi:DNA-binding PadR family transcriptional regulator
MSKKSKPNNKPNNKKEIKKAIPLPKDEVLREIALTLKRKIIREEQARKYAKVKEILTLLASGALLATVFIMPGMAKVLPRSSGDYQENWREWKRFNPAYLRRSLKRLKKQKLVEIEEENGLTTIKITTAGKRKVLKYALEELEIAQTKSWDGKWRLIIYDIPQNKRRLSNLLSQTLKNLGFFALQKSVYLIPYPCQSQIEFIREYFGLGDNVLILEVAKIENDKPFREYFGL